MSLLNFYIVAVVLLFLKKVLQEANFEIDTKIDKDPVFWLVIATSVCIATYQIYSRKNFTYYEEKFSECVELNRRVKLWMLIAFPFILLFLSFFVYVVMFGGQILGKEITGVWG